MNNSISTLFSGFNRNDSLTSGLYGSLSELNSIRSGSYKKLLTKYYGEVSPDSKTSSKVERKTDTFDWRKLKEQTSSTSKTSNAKQSTATSTASTTDLADVKKSAETLKNSTATLLKRGKGSVFSKKDDGTYDAGKIYDSVNQFVKDYNALVDSTSKTDSKLIDRNANSMINSTKANSRLLSKFGITIGEDNKLSIDEKKFKASDMAGVSSLFSGSGSFGYQVSTSASVITYNAQSEASKANTYTGSGSYSKNYSNGDIYSRLV